MSIFHTTEELTKYDEARLQKRKEVEAYWNDIYKDNPNYAGVSWKDPDDPFCCEGVPMLLIRYDQDSILSTDNNGRRVNLYYNGSYDNMINDYIID